MTYTSTERLIRRIVEALKNSGTTPNLERLAQDYAEACRMVQLRLEQCGALLNEGNELQAVQLAEVEPPLLDLIRLSGFREAPQWSAYCQENKLPVAVPFDSKIIARLNQAYARGITPNHPLIREYREAVLRRQDIPAMNALRSILRLNPSDKNAQGELERLEKKILGQKLDALSSTIAGGAYESVANQVDEIEALNFKIKPEGPVFAQGLRLREDFLRDCALAEAKSILIQLEPLQAANKWEAAEPMVNRIVFLKSEHVFEFSPDDAAKWSQVHTWLSMRVSENRRDHEFQRVCRDLMQSIEQCDDRQAAQRQMTMAHLRTDLELLVKKHRTVTEFGLKIPPEIDTRYRKRYGMLNAQIAKGQKNRLTLIGAISAVAVILSVIAGYMVHHQQETESLVNEMVKLREGREVSAAETFLKDLPVNSASYINIPQVSAAKSETEAFVQEEHARKNKFDQSLVSLNAFADKQFVGVAPELVQKQFDEAQQQQKQLCQDFQANADAQVLAFKNKWEAFLYSNHDALTQQFSAKLSNLEQLAKDQLDLNRKPEDLAPMVAQINDGLTKLGTETTTNIPQMKLSEDLLGRFSDLQAKMAPYQKQLADFDQEMASVRVASTSDAYLQALQSLGKSELVGATDVVAARRMLEFAPSVDKLTEGLLMPDNTNGWAFFTANPHAPFYPISDVLAPEKTIYDQVVGDPNVHSIFKYKLQPSDGSTQTLFVQGEINYEVDGHSYATKNITDYNPNLNRDSLVFTQDNISGIFTALGESNESQAFQNCNFNGLIDDSGTKFISGNADAPIHQMLDNIVKDSSISSIFKAYLFYNVWKLIDASKRENFWGLQYSPALSQTFNQMNRMKLPASGDWMVPDLITSSQKQWDAFFAPLSHISYYKQGEALRAIYLRVNQTGFDYVGHVDDKGDPQLLQGHGVSNQLWGWDAKKNGPALLFRYSSQEQKYVPSATPLPMSPLFAFKGDLASILQIVRQDQQLTDEEYKNSVEPFLPPLFKLPLDVPADKASTP